MDPPPARASTLRPVVFRDGLGPRHRVVDATGTEKLEVLCLRRDLATAESFELALRERVGRLASLHHEHFARIRTVERLKDPSATLVLVSEPTPGVRLSDLLSAAERHGLPFDIRAGLCLIRQVVSAVAMFHEQAPDVAHGAIAPERIILTPNARLVVVEHVLGSALEGLRFSQERYWTELRIACPRSAALPLRHRADVTQIGVVALSLILGRPLSDDDYPSRLEELIGSARAVSANGDSEPIPPGLRSWLVKALQLDARNYFASAIDASAEFDRMLDEIDYIRQILRRGPQPPAIFAAPELESFLARYQECVDWPIPAEPARPIAVAPPKPPPIAPVAPVAAADPWPKVMRTERTVTRIVPTVSESFPPGVMGRAHTRNWRRTAAATVLLTALTGAGMAAWRLRPAWGEREAGLAPVARLPTIADSSATEHDLVLENEAGSTKQTVTIETAASIGAQRVAPQSAPGSGWITVSAPSDVQLYEGGSLIGSSQSDRIVMSAGTHQLELVNEALGYRSERTVQVTGGAVSPIKVDFPKGTIAVNAIPWAVVWIDGEEVGETPIGNLQVNLGPHEVVFRNPGFGERRQTATVTLTAPTRLSVDLRKE